MTKEEFLEKINLDGLYLFRERFGYKIAKIDKVNKVSVSLDNSYGNIRFDDFLKDIRELTPIEVARYEGAMIKHMSDTRRQLADFNAKLSNTIYLLENNESFVKIDVEEIKLNMALINELLKDEVCTIMELQGKLFDFKNKYNSNELVEVTE